MPSMFHLVLLFVGLLDIGVQETTAASCAWKDALSVNGKCFKFVTEAKTWEDAEKYCQSLPGGGLLAQINSQAELLQLETSKFGIKCMYWIGANDVQKEGAYMWSDGSAANLNGMWAQNQPDNFNNEDCVMVYPGGKDINDIQCSTTLPFMCMEKRCSWSGALPINGRCFKYVSEGKTWEDAQNYCQSLPGGGVLAQVNSRAELLQLEPSRFGITSNFWIGANDIKTEGVYSWTDGTAAVLSGLWAPKQPDNYNNEDCVMVYPSGKDINDVQCSSSLPFLCMEKPCSWKGALSINGKCYKYVAEGKTWDEAKKYCEALPGGGLLAQVNSRDQLLQLEPSRFGINSMYWIGANDIKTEGAFAWTDGSAANLNGLWATNQPDNFNNEDCVMVYPSGKDINDIQCSTQIPFMCMEQSCSWKDALNINGKLYKFVSEGKSWEDAKKCCESLPDGGMLAKVNSQAELLQLEPSRFGITTHYWIGANDIRTEGSYTWTDGTSANLNGLWAQGQPDNFNNEDCVMVYSSGKDINDLMCSSPLPFMCMAKPGAEKQPTCTAVVDLIYVLDSSGSIGIDNYQKQINFTIDLASNLKIGPQNVLVGAVVFSNAAEKYFDLKDYPTFANLRKALSATPYKGYTTHTDEALDLITNAGMFTPSAGARSNSFKTVIVITDGQSDNPTKTQQAAARLKSQGITVNAVGIGSAVDSELLAISSGARNVFKATNFDALKQIVTSVTQQACRGL